jgi:hypothetical protein
VPESCTGLNDLELSESQLSLSEADLPNPRYLPTGKLSAPGPCRIRLPASEGPRIDSQRRIPLIRGTLDLGQGNRNMSNQGETPLVSHGPLACLIQPREFRVYSSPKIPPRIVGDISLVLSDLKAEYNGLNVLVKERDDLSVSFGRYNYTKQTLRHWRLRDGSGFIIEENSELTSDHRAAEVQDVSGKNLLIGSSTKVFPFFPTVDKSITMNDACMAPSQGPDSEIALMCILRFRNHWLRMRIRYYFSLISTKRLFMVKLSRGNFVENPSNAYPG